MLVDEAKYVCQAVFFSCEVYYIFYIFKKGTKVQSLLVLKNYS